MSEMPDTCGQSDRSSLSSSPLPCNCATRPSVVEAGCKTVVGQRAKQSGMCWTESGLLAVLHTRCALLGGQFDAFWNNWNHPSLSVRAFHA